MIDRNRAAKVVTPMSQAMSATAMVSRGDLKALMKRTNGPGLVRLALWLGLLGTTGLLVWLALGSWLVWPAMFIHGVVFVHHFSLQHECSHYTAFRTRRLNHVLAYYCGFALFIPPKFFRYEHCDHHTYTQIDGQDPELIELPASLAKYLLYVSAIPYWKAQFSTVARHFAGIISEDDKRFIPKSEYGKLFLEARLMVALYASVLAVMLLFDWYMPLWFWWLPMFMGEPVMRAIRMTEHVGRPAVGDMRENTRTCLVSWPLRLLCWNMNYHAEHHYASSIPFHALPKLHEKIRDRIYVEKGGYLGAHRDIIARILCDAPRPDPLQVAAR